MSELETPGFELHIDENHGEAKSAYSEGHQGHFIENLGRLSRTAWCQHGLIPDITR